HFRASAADEKCDLRQITLCTLVPSFSHSSHPSSISRIIWRLSAMVMRSYQLRPALIPGVEGFVPPDRPGPMHFLEDARVFVVKCPEFLRGHQVGRSGLEVSEILLTENGQFLSHGAPLSRSRPPRLRRAASRVAPEADGPR